MTPSAFFVRLSDDSLWEALSASPPNNRGRFRSPHNGALLSAPLSEFRPATPEEAQRAERTAPPIVPRPSASPSRSFTLEHLAVGEFTRIEEPRSALRHRFYREAKRLRPRRFRSFSAPSGEATYIERLR